MALIIRGKELAQEIRTQAGSAIAAIQAQTGRTPGLAVIQVGDDPSSAIYVRNKQKACAEIGIRSFGYHLPAETTQQELLDLISALNQDSQVHGILCQMPLPEHIDDFTIICAISPEKDIDGFHPINAALLSLGRDCLVPCTPAGVLAMLKTSGQAISGQHCVIIGRSSIVGKPMAQLMLRENATVTIAHSRTRNLPQLCREADILIVAIGRAGFITGEYVKPGAVVIDVGINRKDDGKVVGDVDFASAESVASAITPVPNGVGPMTIAMLMQNTLLAFRRQEKLI